jgi:DNA topoisomerase-1
LKELGADPRGAGPITVRTGRYGPYVNRGKLNATLPRSLDPESITLDQALQLLAEKEGTSGSRRQAAKSPSRKRAPSRASKAQAAE